MEAEAGFVCAQCGTEHAGYPTDRGYKLPDEVWAVPESEREARAHFDTDLCEMDGRYFIRGVLYLPLVERNDQFGWGVWAEIERAGFVRYVEIYNADASNEPPISGTLANVIPGYEGAANARLVVKFGRQDDRPEFFLEARSESSLAKDQRSGIDDQRYHDMLVTAGVI